MKSCFFFFQGFLTTGQPLPSSEGGEAQKCTSACINQHHPAPRGLKHPAEQPILHPSLQLPNPPAKPRPPLPAPAPQISPWSREFPPRAFWSPRLAPRLAATLARPGQAGLTGGLGAEDALCLWFVCLFWVYTIIRKSLVLAGNFKRTKQNKETAPSRLIAATVTWQSFSFPWG